jgi:hypothetical protein
MEQVQQVLRGDLTALERVAVQIAQVYESPLYLFKTNKENETHKTIYEILFILKITFMRKWRLLTE